MSDAWQRLDSETLTDQVYRSVREKLLRGSWEPGIFVREQQISDNLGVSRTPVREALGRLAADGFLERVPRRGFRVPEQTVEDLLELYPILARLETLAASQAFRVLGPAELADLRQINLQYAEACRRADIKAGIELNNRFHHKLSEQAGNRRLCDMLDELRHEVVRMETWAFSRFENWERSIREHEEILEAIERGDHATALETLEANRLMTYRRFQRRESRDELDVGLEDATGS